MALAWRLDLLWASSQICSADSNVMVSLGVVTVTKGPLVVTAVVVLLLSVGVAGTMSALQLWAKSPGLDLGYSMNSRPSMGDPRPGPGPRVWYAPAS